MLQKFLLIIIIAYGAKEVFFTHELTIKDLSKTVDRVNQLSQGGNLLSADGRLIESGWDTKVTKNINYENSAPIILGMKSLNLMRLKRFEYIAVQTEDEHISLSFVETYYSKSFIISRYSFQDNKVTTDEATIQLWGDLKINDRINFRADVSIGSNDKYVRFKDYQQETGNIARDYSIYSEKLLLKADFTVLKDQNSEDLFSVGQIDDDGKYWSVGSKVYGMKTEGTIKLSDRTIRLSHEKNSLAMADISMGQFQYKTNWMWVSFQTVLPDGTFLAVNLGGGFAQTDKDKCPEDFMKINDKVIQLEPVEINFDKDDLMKDWKQITHEIANFSSRTVNLTFTAKKQFSGDLNKIIIDSLFRENFGYFDGYIIDNEGKVIKIDKVFGIVEIVIVRW